MNSTYRLTSLVLGGVFATSLSFGQIALQNASATFSQTLTGPWNASEMIDGDLSANNGWAIFDGATAAQTAVFETVADQTVPGLQITMVQNYTQNPGHLVGRFRWSVTSDDRSLFADGLQNGGDVSANWTVLTPVSVSAPAPLSSTILGDGSILMSTSGALSTADYVVTFADSLTSVTGLRLEVMEDASLPTGGPGMFSNGNFVITEVTAEAVPEPFTLAAIGAGLALVARRRKH
jgi:hypothetical protein